MFQHYTLFASLRLGCIYFAGDLEFRKAHLMKGEPTVFAGMLDEWYKYTA